MISYRQPRKKKYKTLPRLGYSRKKSALPPYGSGPTSNYAPTATTLPNEWAQAIADWAKEQRQTALGSLAGPSYGPVAGRRTATPLTASYALEQPPEKEPVQLYPTEWLSPLFGGGGGENILGTLTSALGPIVSGEESAIPKDLMDYFLSTRGEALAQGERTAEKSLLNRLSAAGLGGGAVGKGLTEIQRGVQSAKQQSLADLVKWAAGQRLPAAGILGSLGGGLARILANMQQAQLQYDEARRLEEWLKRQGSAGTILGSAEAPTYHLPGIRPTPGSAAPYDAYLQAMSAIDKIYQPGLEAFAAALQGANILGGIFYG